MRENEKQIEVGAFLELGLPSDGTTIFNVQVDKSPDFPVGENLNFEIRSNNDEVLYTTPDGADM